jgi:hypothetical protein
MLEVRGYIHFFCHSPHIYSCLVGTVDQSYLTNGVHLETKMGVQKFVGCDHTKAKVKGLHPNGISCNDLRAQWWNGGG